MQLDIGESMKYSSTGLVGKGLKANIITRRKEKILETFTLKRLARSLLNSLVRRLYPPSLVSRSLLPAFIY